MKNIFDIKEDIEGIINDDSFDPNMFYVDQNTSIKVSRLFDLSKSKNLDLIIEAQGIIYYEKGISQGVNQLPLSHRLEESEQFTSRVYVNSCLVKATEDLTKDMIEQFETRFGDVEYELRNYFTENLTLIEANQSSIVIKLESGT